MQTGRRGLRNIIDKTVNLIYPGHCFVCGSISPFGEEICPSCRDKLPYIRTARCEKCGKPIESTERICDDCRERTHIYDEGMGLFLYNDIMREAMVSLKYKHRAEYASPMGHLLYEGSRDKLRKWKPDVIVPIPVHRKRRLTRGYNQAELIANSFSKYSGIPVYSQLLVRREDTKMMKKLTPEERKENLKTAFEAPYHLKRESKILLIDDIYTTGATIDAASYVLREGGCGSVFFLSVCIGSGFMLKYETTMTSSGGVL